jgi:phage gp29-like protein
MKPPIHLRDINRARDYYNPLRGLDVGRVIRLLEDGERGRYHDLQKLNRSAEKRHPTLKALKARRLGALKKLDWSVKVPSELPDGINAAQAERQRVFLRGAYEQIENLPQAFEFLALPSFRGYSHLEPRHRDDDPSEPITRLNPVPQWHWLRDSQTWAWRYDADARGCEATSVEIDPEEFIIREVDDPLCEIALLCLVRRNIAKKDWTSFMEDYAIASVFAMLGENTPLDKVKEWLEVVKQVTSNSRGALPPGSKIEALELGNLDGVQFRNFIAAEDEDLVLAGTGGLLTMLTATTGMNSDQGDAHEKTFAAIALAEAREISAVLQAQFDKRILAREFPSQPAVAYFELAAQDEEDVTALADRVQKFYQAGLESDPEEVSEKVGLKLTRKAQVPAVVPPAAAQAQAAAPGPGEGEKPAQEEAPLANRAAQEVGREARFMAASQAMLSEGDIAALKPILERASALDAITDDAEYQQAYAKFMADLPALEAQCLGDKATATLESAFEWVIGTALVSGLASATEARKTAKTGQGGTRQPSADQNRS